MFKPKLEKLLKDSWYYTNLPVFIRIPALGAIQEEVTKPIVEATLDELEFAALALDKESEALTTHRYALRHKLELAEQALNKQSEALTTHLYAIRRLYKEARSKGALGGDNILDALARKGGAE